MERDIGACGTAVLDNFFCGILEILNTKCGIAALSVPVGWFDSILDDIKTYPPSSSMFFRVFSTFRLDISNES